MESAHETQTPTSDPNFARIIPNQIPDNTLSIEFMLLDVRYGFLVCGKIAAFGNQKNEDHCLVWMLIVIIGNSIPKLKRLIRV